LSSVKIKIKGLDDARTNIQQALQNVEVGTEAALDVVANATLDDDQANCPVRTGYLRDNQQVYVARLDRQIGSDVEYHKYLQFGTYKMAANPFLTNAFEANQNKLVPECLKIKVI
jgi:HK97 gp10 family phage protein